ncbi:MAG: flagellar hook-basal body complex protein FliE [Gammaproteobacteria bacterium]|jgi:flagellar hook-basal body complex protein FliE|nr:flagellar hook-basal body complex protein FliE [Gammaproteobacteria bacterium]
MSQMEINRVLEQIRSLSAQTKLGTAQANQTPPAGGSEFANILRKGVDQVNETAQHAAALSAAFERGTPGVELPQVMLEISKASVSFRALTEVRNRLVTAYQDIMNMQL